MNKTLSMTVGLSTVLLCLWGCEPQTDGDGGESANGDNPEIRIADTPDAITIIDAPETGVALGWGWNRADHEPIPTICVEFVEGREPAQTRLMTMHEANDSYEAMSAVGVSAAASVKTIGFKASAKAEFASEVNINAYSNTFILNAEVHNGVRYASPSPKTLRGDIDFDAVDERGGRSGEIRLTPHAEQLARQKDRAEFQRACGSSFVSAIYGGAKLTAVMTMSSTSKSDKKTMSASMSGSGWGARLEANVKAEEATATENSTMDLSIFLAGGAGDAIPASKQDLLDKLEVLSLEAQAAPKDFSIAITPYELLENWPGRGMPDPSTELDELASYWGAYNTLYDEMQDILDDPAEFATVEIDGSGCVSIVEESKEAAAQRAKMNAELAALQQRMLKQVQEVMSGGIGGFERLGEIVASSQAEQQAIRQRNSQDPTPDRSTNIAAIKRAQDEVLFALRDIQDKAQSCVEKGGLCEFNADDYRHPYAFRLQLLPMLGFADNVSDLVDLFISTNVTSRCQLAPDNMGCISNSEIDDWQEKVGLVPVFKSQEPDRYAMLKAMLDDDTLPERAECANGIPGSAVVSAEMGKDIIWANVNHELLIAPDD